MPETKRPALSRAKKTPRPSTAAAVEPEGNAVERMLAVASEADSLFDSLFGWLRCDAPHAPSDFLRRLLSETVETVAAAPDLAESGLLPYPVTAAQAALMSRWGCYGAVHVAVEKTVSEGIARGERHGSGADLTPQGIETYAGILGKRESLLDAERWLSMVSDVIGDHSSWGNVGGRVVERAEALQAAVQRLRSLGPNPPSCEWQAWADLRSTWKSERASLRAAIDALRAYAKPPKPAAVHDTGSTPKAKPRNAGGRKPKWTAEQKKHIRNARGKEMRKRQPKLLKLWLTDYAGANGMARADAKKLWNATKAADHRAKLR